MHMIERVRNRLAEVWKRMVSSIAFYPSLITIALFLLSFVMLNIDGPDVTAFLEEHAPFLVLNDADTARAILTTLIGGIISLTVFSFSMVMLLLNQASSNFSPRLLPGLISNRQNQFVLGVYIGTILFNIIILISILPGENKYELKTLSILLGIILGLFCLGLFVFFIHSISTKIQIDHILSKIYRSAKSNLLDRISEFDLGDKLNEGEDTEYISFVKSARTGYFGGVLVDGLRRFIDDRPGKVRVLVRKGEYVLEDMEVMALSIDIDEEDRKTLEELLMFNTSNNAEDDYYFGIQQITEVGLKAMSPGINDPGTAGRTIEFLTELLSLRMKLPDYYKIETEADETQLIIEDITFKDLLYRTMASYRQYCKHDVIIMNKLLSLLVYLKKAEKLLDSYDEIVNNQISILAQDAETDISNHADKAVLLERVESILDGRE